MKRDLGKLGESTLELWAAACGVAAQKVSCDVSGWDYLLEFPIERRLSEGGQVLPQDLSHPPLQCLVQVKATDFAPGFDVKLASGHKLALTQGPAFFLLLRFRGSSEALEAFLVPIDRQLLSRILERSRKADLEGKPLSAEVFTLSPIEASRISASGEGLVGGIRSHVGVEHWSYRKQKEAWINEVGYEDGGREFVFDLPPDSGDSLSALLAELAVGLRSEIPIENIRVEDHRFGLKSPVPIAEAKLGQIVASPIAIDASLGLRCGGKTGWARVSLFAPHGLEKVVDRADVKLRLHHEFFEIVLAPKTLSASWTFVGSEEGANLKSLSEAAGLLEVVVEASCSQSKIEVMLDCEGAARWTGEADSPAVPEQLSEVVETIRDARVVARFLDLLDETTVDLSRLLAQRMRFRFLRAIVDPSGPRVEIVLPRESGADLVGRKACAIQSVEVEIGRWWCLVVVTCTGRIQSELNRVSGAQRFVLESPDRRVAKRAIGTRDDLRGELETLESEVADSLDDEVVIVKR